jgi:hypothetical protein
MRFVRLVMMLSVLTVAVAHTAQGQQEVRRRGFWIGFGLGAGWNTSEGLDADRRVGGAGYIHLGGTISPNVLLGGETIGWARTEDDVTLARGNATFTAMIYPSRTGGFYIKGGIGFSTVSVALSQGNTTVSTSESGFGSTIGLGYDIPLGRVSLTPAADFLIQAFDAGQNLASTNTMLLLTLGLAWY